MTFFQVEESLKVGVPRKVCCGSHVIVIVFDVCTLWDRIPVDKYVCFIVVRASSAMHQQLLSQNL